jgi:hypothetical protein
VGEPCHNEDDLDDESGNDPGFFKDHLASFAFWILLAYLEIRIVQALKPDILG